jgi:predicted acyltransferase
MATQAAVTIDPDPPGPASDRDPLRGRLVSLDAFRGITIAGMILVNNPGSWSHVYEPLRHAEWHGWTPTDLVFPFFLFIVGVALPFSFRKRIARGAGRAELLLHVVQRATILFGLGLFMAWWLRFDLSTLRIPGVLQRIAVVYVFAAAAYLFLRPKPRFALTVTLLLGYWAVLTLVPVPGQGAGVLTPDGNLAAWLDRLLLDGHLWSQSRTWDPEGVLSTVPAVASALVGVHTGEWLRRTDRSPHEKTLGMVALGALSVGVGIMWDGWFPINKNLWTSSYVAFTSGVALVSLAACYWLIDARGARTWARPAVIYGRNALAVFVASGLLAKTLALTRVPTVDGDTSLYAWIFQHGFAPWAKPLDASLAFAIATVVFWWVVLWGMDRKGIYIKV